LKIPVHAPHRLRRPQGQNFLRPVLHFHCHQGIMDAPITRVNPTASNIIEARP
jgi:hypothetical protein